jgi:hypothetical protein
VYPVHKKSPELQVTNRNTQIRLLSVIEKKMVFDFRKNISILIDDY